MSDDEIPDFGPTIKDDATYLRLRKEGASKEKAARIANAAAQPGRNPFEEGGKAPPYEEWSREDLVQRARELEIKAPSEMTKDELIEALRNR